MTDAEQLATIKSQALQRIAEITAQPKPSYAIDGQRVEWADYLKQLQATVAWCDARLAAERPLEFESRAWT